MQRIASFCLAAAWLVTAGCAAQSAVEADENPDATGQRNGMTPVTDEPASPAMEAMALKIAGEHLSVPVGELELVRIEPVQWRDSSLGCPQPGMNYMQVITPGHLALVRQAGVVHRVHMAEGRGFVCEKRPAKTAAKGPQPLLTFSQPQLELLARADLAHRLGVRSAEVSIMGSQSVVWPDAALGCGAADEPSGFGQTKGFVIMLAHEGREYEYHADLRSVIPCPPIEAR
ncbi:MAG: hypothetical protein ACREVN_12505 [Gammaproteobacteria bacterium]